MSAHTLQVLSSGTQVGSVDHESFDERYSFRYAPQWGRDRAAYSISPHITILGPDAASGTVRRFLENLLPEGRALEALATAHRVARNNLYGLIHECGQETSGALSFSAEEARDGADGAGREVTSTELARRIHAYAHHPFSVWDGRVHVLIAGAQDKLPVYQDQNGRMYLAGRRLASTHILKPQPSDARLPFLVANEHFCMCLARRLELAAAPVSILRVPDPILVVERFDRLRDGQRVRRVHVIDGCQALNLPVAYKYEHNIAAGRDTAGNREGVSFERLFSVADYSLNKDLTRLMLLRWALFQYLIGNSDAHAKNISFFCEPSGLTLAPHYDLASVAQYPGFRRDLAMAYGDQFSLDAIGAYDWAGFAARTGTPRRLLVREMRRLGAAAPAATALQVADPAYAGQEKDFVARIGAFVQAQATRLTDMAEPVLKADLE
ncbi:MAG TPA: HipA domain-containing protein [Steroidobacteraceae bacterium]|nr:HipA domain-containing protein [Steroidobacteraceae bacterium]